MRTPRLIHTRDTAAMTNKGKIRSWGIPIEFPRASTEYIAHNNEFTVADKRAGIYINTRVSSNSCLNYPNPGTTKPSREIRTNYAKEAAAVYSSAAAVILAARERDRELYIHHVYIHIALRHTK